VSIILGINTLHAGSSAALIVDGVPVAAIAEERLNRVKYYANFPALAVRKCLDMAGLQFRDIDHVAVGRDSAANRTKKVEYALRNPSKLLNLLKIKAARQSMDSIRSIIARECEVDASELRFQSHEVEHHLAHIASSYFISPWDRCAGFSMDGSGDFVTCMLARCEGREIEVLHRVYVPHSIGSFYTMICELIGYGRYGDEGKVMGLAPYGEDTYGDQLADMIRFTGTGFELDTSYFMPFGSNQGMRIDDRGQMVVSRHHSDKVVDLLGPPREPGSEITKRDRDLAFGVQHLFEKVYMHMLNILHGMVPESRVAMAGGCALNSVANGKLFDQTPFRETVIQPAAGDEGLAMGAALYVSQSVLGDGERFVMEDPYFGPEYSDQKIQTVLDDKGVDYRKLDRDSMLDETAAALALGDVVGWFQGRMEWGPRALGNRSILANPTLPDMKDTLNARIKRREPFRPFAPVVLAERQNEVFEHDHPSPFMLHVYKIRPTWREKLLAVNHIDDTGRLQSVSREENGLYYDLISRFDGLTGVPVLLNTSFNENEPIVCSPEEAVECYLRTKVDFLCIGSFVCRKSRAG
jgi:carbamoyltransferase